MKEKSKFALVSTTVVSTNDKNKTVLSNMLHVQNVNYVILKIQYKKTYLLISPIICMLAIINICKIHEYVQYKPYKTIKVQRKTYCNKYDSDSHYVHTVARLRLG